MTNASDSKPDKDAQGAKLSPKPKEENQCPRKGGGRQSIGKRNEWYVMQCEDFSPSGNWLNREWNLTTSGWEGQDWRREGAGSRIDWPRTHRPLLLSGPAFCLLLFFSDLLELNLPKMGHQVQSWNDCYVGLLVLLPAMKKAQIWQCLHLISWLITPNCFSTGFWAPTCKLQKQFHQKYSRANIHFMHLFKWLCWRHDIPSLNDRSTLDYEMGKKFLN